VERVELSRDGVLYLCAHTPTSMRWFAESSGALEEIHPEGDTSLALCKRLGARTGEQSVRILSWRPGRRITFELGRSEEAVVLKGFRARRAGRAAAVHERLFSFGKSKDCFCIPRLVAWSDPESSLTMERLEGTNLPISVDGAESYRRAGRALLKMQRVVPIDSLSFHGWREELAALDAAGERARALGAESTEWMEVRDRLSALESPIDEEGAVAAHRDLHDEQMLIVDGRIALLDYDLFTSSSSLLDAANLVTHLHLRGLQGRATPAGVRACETAFRQGFELGEEPELERRLHALRAASALRLAAVYAIRPRWPGLSSPLLALTKEALDRARA
jgi:hypothetical protein